MSAQGRRKLLILSFSPIAQDARVLKQVALFTPQYDVTTCGYGPAPDGVAEHIRIPDGCSVHDLDGRLISLRQYRRAYWRLGAVAWCHQQLTPRSWEVVLANDVEAVPVALSLKPPLGVHADLHEYTPRLHEQIPAWKRRIKPFYDWLCRRHVSRASSWTTVSNGLAREYQKEFGFLPQIVTNAAPYARLAPGAVGDRVRLVHSGACLRDRNLMVMLDALGLVSRAVSLDLFLTPNDPAYLEELKQRAAADPRISVHEPVPYSSLNATLNAFDVGVHVLPPVNFNNSWALPNKFFDYVQARLGVIIGPSPEMASLVNERGLGVVTEDFSVQALARVIDALTCERVAVFKSNSDAAAESVSAASQAEVWERAINALANRSV